MIYSKNKKIILIVILFLFPFIMYANTGTEEVTLSLKTLLVTIFSILSSWWMDVIYLSSIIGIGIGLIMNRDNKQFRTKLIGWLIAVIILSSISNLVVTLFQIKENLSSIVPVSVF